MGHRGSYRELIRAKYFYLIPYKWHTTDHIAHIDHIVQSEGPLIDVGGRTENFYLKCLTTHEDAPLVITIADGR